MVLIVIIKVLAIGGAPRLVWRSSTPMRGKNKSLSDRVVFGKNVKRARLLKELSQEALSMDAGLARSYLGGVERGQRNISIDNMSRLAFVLGIPLKELVDPDRFRDKLDAT